MGGHRVLSTLSIAAVIAVFGVATFWLVRPKDHARHAKRHGASIRAGAGSGAGPATEAVDDDDDEADLPAMAGSAPAQAGGPRILASADMSGPPKDAEFEKTPPAPEVPQDASPPKDQALLPGPPDSGILPREESGPPR